MQDRPAEFQKGLFGDEPKPARQARIEFDATAARRSLLDRLESFLTRHTGSDDLGLRLAGEQLAAGVRFVRMVREGAYDLVVANPPYQGTSKMAEAKYIEQQYPLGKADLYAAFLLRGLELVREGGVSAMLTMRNWMFIKQYSALREELLKTHGLNALGDLDWGSFAEMKDVKAVLSVFQRNLTARKSLAISPTGTTPSGRTLVDYLKKQAGLLLAHEGYQFRITDLTSVPERPVVYWWTDELSLYKRYEMLGGSCPARATQGLYNNTRFVRTAAEIPRSHLRVGGDSKDATPCFVPLTNGADGAVWFEPLRLVVAWGAHGIAPKLYMTSRTGGAETYRYANEQYFFRRGGVAYASIGSSFSARMTLYAGTFANMGRSVFSEDPAQMLCRLNSATARGLMMGLNPGVHFEAGDINRLPMFPIARASEIIATLEEAFTARESHREPSVEFQQPGPSPWRHAQEWAQLAVDRPEGEPLPAYVEELDREPPTDHLSYALGVALGRFGPNGEGILDPATADLAHALPGGILFLDRTLEGDGTKDRHDSLFDVACKPLHEAWAAYAERIDTNRRTLRDWLALDFFGDVHKGMYENRPIHWPLASPSKTFVAWVNIHRFTDRTLRLLLADHLVPRLTQIGGELSDLRTARDGADKKAAREADDRVGKIIKARDELAAFIKSVEACADVGPPPTDATCPAREQDARYAPDLDDGVMINSAALWPLLEPQWRDPKKWWKELAQAKGRKDYDWSHLAMRYWPTRVDAKCQEDPSLAVAHGCFWRYHPARAWAWELRLQQEIGPDFRITEPPYTPGGQDVGEPADHGDAPHRAAWLRDHAEDALAAVEKEAERRQGRAKRRTTVPEMALLEPRLWSAMPAEVWRMEMRLSERQGAEFRLIAPDEPAARAAYAEAHPDLARARAAALAQLKPVAEMFAEDDEDDGDGDDMDADETPDEEDGGDD